MSLSVVTDVAAPAELLWEVVADVRRWPDRLTTVDAVELLGPAPFGPGSQARVTQPRLRPTVWTVTRWEPGWRFTWEGRAPGVRTVAGHAVEPLGTGSRLTLTLAQSGPLAPLVRLLLGRTTARYVHAEAAGLKTAAEAAAR